jgi:beta-lactamase class A
MVNRVYSSREIAVQCLNRKQTLATNGDNKLTWACALKVKIHHEVLQAGSAGENRQRDQYHHLEELELEAEEF